MTIPSGCASSLLTLVSTQTATSPNCSYTASQRFTPNAISTQSTFSSPSSSRARLPTSILQCRTRTHHRIACR
ncbi:hypothetical protein P171DRAFT_432613 [Karstenula rhodostoma CBS 690.94]|uniref:Uncharacterized protein n=1 Tax=Karstenula rhodostoma CBS 690.94 TaxID=1392251 RepID=A0A9P4PE21_9PLEO|nr:hypothetical protein P171DRAFT_432613 [Karstenula rhodostoma CBS 690.94]